VVSAGEPTGRPDRSSGILNVLKNLIMLRKPTILLLSILCLAGLAWADGPNQAGLIIQFDGEKVETFCLGFEGDEIKGADLLTRSGLGVIMDTAGNMGVTICQIEGQGCVFPAEHCFCQCMGGDDCAYWNYYYRDPGEADWIYSPLGAALRKVKPGSVEAWVWGDGHSPPADIFTFEAICARPTPTNTQAPTLIPESPTPTAATASTLEPTEQTPRQTPTQSPTTRPSVTAQPPGPTPAPVSMPETAPSLSSYWPFGLMILGLFTIGAIVWHRRT
jgi:hypothetical protein